jgi:molybdate transport system ATP-binding protein
VRRAVDVPLVLVTHDFEDVVRLATHLAIVHAGRVIAHGSLASLTSRPDLPWLRAAVGLGAVVDATVLRVDAGRRLAELEIGGAVLLAPQARLTAGSRVRVRIPAREVILATETPSGLSVHNVLAAAVAGVTVDDASESAIVQLAVGRTRLLAEVTRDAVSRLGIAEGMAVQALIKSMALEVLSAEPGAEEATA